MEYVVEMQGIRKAFPGILANDDITLQLRKGEIHALLGENGAGKSTLMSILFGLYQADAGRILVRGSEVEIANPTAATNLGIGMVHQHFKLVQNFTVTENIVLGLEPHRFGVLNMQQAEQRVAELSRRYNLNVEPRARIEDISVGMQQRVEILKMLYRDAEVLIFDEPTAVLTPQEILDLMQIMRDLIAEGKSIILITHKLKEIKAIAERCTVIRRGRYIGTVEVAATSEAQMAQMMVGREVSFHVDKQPRQPGEVVLEIRDLAVQDSRKLPAVKGVSLQLRRGEILGLAGVDGNGQTELVEALIGLRRVESGSIILDGRDITNAGIRQRIEQGIAHIPEDRQKRGLVLDYSLEENLVLSTHRKPPFARWGLLQFPAIRAHADRIRQAFDVRTAKGVGVKARTMSGGNQQKAIIGREVDHSPLVLVAVQPTRGLDVGSIAYIHRRLVENREAGKAVLLVSLELDEILDLSDRIAVINHGEIVGEVEAAATNEYEVGLMMAGVHKESTS
ncbi:ABC transporter ATP-binding protein [Spirochaeta africana]|uniref:ATPase component of uncharacterized ABC-type transporter n=1 Tax=Spirochaeta africana (strain ATCC 700263 / DSM 8902 / Z-7692) TaxID=889378 RepID=H9UIC4_SPIAZ|nr:ABC transporter ATP-binding protein [Spirochaeta africana]AFG37267.1 ATPase component of uncharacterized ABC-type transporter [Spirochaeta africana DSM 8902]